MGNDLAMKRDWYFTSPEAISRYLTTVIRGWGYKTRWNLSDNSESVYIKACLGTKEAPKSLHIRMSNHTLPPNSRSMYNYDVYCGHRRKEATSYVKLLSGLAERLGKPLPCCLRSTNVGTKQYKTYSIEMQRRGKQASDRGSLFLEERLYVYE